LQEFHFVITLENFYRNICQIINEIRSGHKRLLKEILTARTKRLVNINLSEFIFEMNLFLSNLFLIWLKFEIKLLKNFITVRLFFENYLSFNIRILILYTLNLIRVLSFILIYSQKLIVLFIIFLVFNQVLHCNSLILSF
jgi:hypothetical protein